LGRLSCGPRTPDSDGQSAVRIAAVVARSSLLFDQACSKLAPVRASSSSAGGHGALAAEVVQAIGA
jgi:hypothetical protein